MRRVTVRLPGPGTATTALPAAGRLALDRHYDRLLTSTANNCRGAIKLLRQPVIEMPSFFHHVVISADEAARHPGAIRQLRREECEGILVTEVYDPHTCAAVCERLQGGGHGLIETSFPAPFRSSFRGMNLNLAAPDLGDYFRAMPTFKIRLAQLFSGFVNLESRVTGILSDMDDGRRYRAAPGPHPGLDHMFTTLREHRTGGFIPQHFDNEQESRDSYRLIRDQAVSDIFSFVLAFSRADDGGALEIFNLRHAGRRFRMVDGEDDASHLAVDQVERVAFRLAPGEMMIFNSGRYLHRVTPVIGPRSRWTACSFMAQSRDGDVICWG